jgi:2,4-dienoyl-CoA reductase-like NADH-dependent reductase (Old Yellow Enzyme family)
MQTILPDIVKAGADIIHASIGTHGSPGAITQATAEYEPGFNVGLAKKIKEVVSVPVIAVGRFSDPALADEVIGRGDADLVAFGRQFLADPDFLIKTKSGRSADRAASNARYSGKAISAAPSIPKPVRKRFIRKVRRQNPKGCWW